MPAFLLGLVRAIIQQAARGAFSYATRPVTARFVRARGVLRALRRGQLKRYLGTRLERWNPMARKVKFYRSHVKHVVEYRNTYSRGVIGGFVARNYPREVREVKGARGALVLVKAGDFWHKVKLKPARKRRAPRHLSGGALMRRRLRRSVLGV